MPNVDFWVIFSTGLFTGGLTCMAVQGGLLATTIAQRTEEKYEEKLKIKAKRGHAAPILWFLLAKLIAYTILGLGLGWLGSLFVLSARAQLILQFAVGIFMLGTAGALLNLHPVFRYFIIQPPGFLTRLIRKESKSKDIFAPALLGLMTVLIPCGTTQAMMALAVASGNVVKGAAIMFAFVLGTIPVFFILGYFASRLGEIWSRKFLKVAAFGIILLALFNINNSVALTGSQLTFGSVLKKGWCALSYCESENSAALAGAEENIPTEATINIEPNGYAPNRIFVKAGSRITLRLVNKDAYSCAQAFTIPKLGIRKIVRPGTSEDIVFSAPNQKQQIAFMCSMGMFRGVINVIN